MEYILLISSISSKLSGGSTPAIAFASMVFPDHGGHERRTLCIPAAATVIALLMRVWPLISAKSMRIFGGISLIDAVSVIC